MKIYIDINQINSFFEDIIKYEAQLSIEKEITLECAKIIKKSKKEIGNKIKSLYLKELEKAEIIWL